MKPLVSVCVPTWNGAKYLRECLDSVLAQTLGDFELLVVDDQSSDETYEIAHRYSTRDPRIRLFRNHENLGLVGNLNRCLELTTGEWIKFVFQDDWIESNCLERLTAASDCPMIVCRRRFVFDGVNEDTELVYQRLLEEYSIDALFPGLSYIPPKTLCETILSCLNTNFIGEPIAVMIHESVRRPFGVFHPHLIQVCDMEYWFRIAVRTGLAYVPETLAHFRVHPENVTTRQMTHQRYRGEIIDQLVLLYEYAYSPHYAPLRKTARLRNIDLKKEVVKYGVWAQALARRAASNPLGPDKQPLKEWERIAADYPELSTRADVSELRRQLDKHVLWRFKRANSKSVTPRSDRQISIIVSIDVEPDRFFVERNSPVAWNGFEAVYAFFHESRRHFGEAAQFSWFLRMDPQIQDTYGCAAWAVHHYEKLIDDLLRSGDGFGLHVHAFHWAPNFNSWVVDHGNQPWVDHCVKTGFEAFHQSLNTPCEYFRFGDGWINNDTIRLIEGLGARVDLTLEPGQEGKPAVFPAKPFTGSIPDLTEIPRTPYRPDLKNFMKPDLSRTDGILLIPLSSGSANGEWGRKGHVEPEKKRYQTLNLAIDPETFSRIVDELLVSQNQSYLAVVVRSDVGIKRPLMQNLKDNLYCLLSHSFSKRFAFCTPLKAVAALGY